MNPWSNPSITSWQIYHRKIKRFSFISLPIRHIPPNASCTVFLWFLRTQTINNYVACIFVRWWTVTCKWRQHIRTRRIFTCSFKNLHTHTRMHTYKVVRHAYISQPFDRINESGREQIYNRINGSKWKPSAFVLEGVLTVSSEKLHIYWFILAHSKCRLLVSKKTHFGES